MENSSKALLVAGAMLVCILLVAVVMFVSNGSQGTINDAMSSMSTQEIDAFNMQFTMYEGEQTGANIKSLVGTLISNSNTNQDEVSKIPGVYFESKDSNLDSGIPESGNTSNYIKELEEIKKNVDTKHKYWIEITYQDIGIIDYINISYDKSDMLEPMYR